MPFASKRAVDRFEVGDTHMSVVQLWDVPACLIVVRLAGLVVGEVPVKPLDGVAVVERDVPGALERAAHPGDVVVLSSASCTRPVAEGRR